MLVLLPPSETKRDGGDDTAVLDLTRLSYPALTGPRKSAIKALKSLSRNLNTMGEALKLGPTQHDELLRNRAIAKAPLMPAIERYTGVLYDALDAASLPLEARDLARSTIVIHSALFGLVGADDPIPAYRVSHDSRLPGVRLRNLWRDAIERELGRNDGLILDLRSEAYVAMGPTPTHANAYFLRVVSEGQDGQKRALNHFNKKGKGAFVRTLLETGVDHGGIDSLIDWADRSSIRLVSGVPGELELTVDEVVPQPRATRQQPSK